MEELEDIFKDFLPILESMTDSPLATAIIKQTIKIVNRDTEQYLLFNISDDVRRLLRGYLIAGKTHLEDALQSSNLQSRRKYIHDAREAFVMAAAIEYSPDNARAMEYVGICHELLKDYELANSWYVKAYNSLVSEHSSAVAWLTNFESESSQSIRTGIDILKSALIVPIFFDAVKGIIRGDLAEDDKAIKHWNKLVYTFKLETQLRHLKLTLRKKALNSNNHIQLYYPETVTNIRKGDKRGYKGVRVLTLFGSENSHPVFEVKLGWGKNNS